MEIKISNEESHLIKIPDEVSVNEFRGLMIKLRELEKFIEKFFSYEDVDDVKKERKIVRKYKKRFPPEQRPWTQSKNEAVKWIKLHYFGSKEEKLKAVESIGRDWNDVTKSLGSVREKFNITPEEVGLIRFPRKHETRDNYDYLLENGNDEEKEETEINSSQE